MTPTLAAIVLWFAAYLLGAIPFGYVIGRMRGVDLFREGSGNIGATNTARVLGRRWGILVFLLDFAKGAIPVAVAIPLAKSLHDETMPPNLLRVGAALLAFLGHLFPIYLGFRGGKGVATGAGAVCVLAPLPAAIAILAWGVVFLASRTISIASLAAVGTLAIGGVLQPHAFSADTLPITLFLMAGAAMVAVKHRANIRRCLEGTEKPMMADSEKRQSMLRSVHLLAAAMLFGGSAFFNFAAAPAIFRSFDQVVADGPSDRTAHVAIISASATTQEKKDLASALAGAAVGPIFPMLFGMQAVCVGIALVTALAWRNSTTYPKAAKWRVRLLVVSAVLVAADWALSIYLADLRPKRFDPSAEVAQAARASFMAWHFVSLGISMVTVVLAAIVVALGAKLPERSGASTSTA